MPQGMLTGQDLPPVATLALLPAPSSCPGCRCFVVEAGYEVFSTGSAWVANGAGALLAQAKSYADTQDSGHASNRSAHGLGVSTAHVEAAVIGSALELVAEADGALVATSFIGTWAQPTTPEP